MRALTEQVTINAPSSEVWDALADFGGVSDWAPYMKESHLIGNIESGVGTRRSMRHSLGFRFEEKVTAWQDEQGYSFDVFRAPFPMTDVHESWKTGRSNGYATVTTHVEYDMKLGALGQLLDWLLVRFIVRREMRSGLRGLKHHVEAAAERQGTVQFAD
jgi:ligand-binding SRPBCC domain-containing protein